MTMHDGSPLNPFTPLEFGMIKTAHNQADEISLGRRKAHHKHGSNSIEAKTDNAFFLACLMEEVGEAAHEMTYDADGSLRAELIDCAVVISAWIAKLDREGH
jgi:hypothetical protein